MSLLEPLAKMVVKYVNKKNPRIFMKETLIIGLGNPGKQYEWTRHNLGWLALDQLVGRGLCAAPDEAWQKHHKANALICKLDLGGQPVVLMKPQTMMNDSGKAVRDYLAFHKGSPQQIIVVHDDLDLEFGRLKIVVDGSAAGHKGVQSIMTSLKTQEFTRLRLGIRNKDVSKIPADRFVLQPFSFFEKRKVKKWLPEIADALACLAKNDPESCMNKFH